MAIPAALRRFDNIMMMQDVTVYKSVDGDFELGNVYNNIRLQLVFSEIFGIFIFTEVVYLLYNT